VNVSEAIPSSHTAAKTAGPVLRYTLTERIHHWIAALTYIYCLLTGLAFWSPYLFWMAVIVGGGAAARFWHPWSGLFFTASVFWMYKVWRKDMLTTDADRAWWKAVQNYIRNEDQNLPPIWRFNLGQKMFFWLMFYGVILLLLSGIALWFVESIPWSLRWVRYLAIAVHVAVALATIGGFIIHVYMGTAMERGAFGSVIRGDVSRAWADKHHHTWYEQILRGSAARK